MQRGKPAGHALVNQAAPARGRAVGRQLNPSRWTPRIRRRVRRVAFGALAVWVCVTVASVSYNVATNHVPARPPGLTFVRAGDINTRYRAWGTTGSAIVLVPGAFETADTFAALGADLGRDHRAFSLDLTGTGYSQPRPPFTTAHLAAQLLDFLTAMRLTGADTPLLVGHSSGAAVIGLAALQHPDAVAAVMFLDGDAAPLPLPAIVGSLFIDPYRTTLFRMGLRSDWVVRHIYNSQCGPACPRLNSAGVQLWRRPLQQSGTTAVLSSTLRHGIPSMTAAQLDTLRALRIPKSVVFGAADPQYSPTTPAKVAARIGAPAPTLVPGRHLTMISAPQQVAIAVRQLAARASH
jgi:pimeloyl-ACP methyl ester carboxylesterase